MKVAVLGYGMEGRSSAIYWQGLGHEVTVCDAKANLQLPAGTGRQLGADYLAGLDKFDLIVRSPGVKPTDIVAASPDLDPAKITSGTNEFLAQCPAKIIGVTGTKGKGTTSSLIAEILKAAGRRVHLGGNIGRPPLDFLADVRPDDWVVLELSSFQLADVRRSPHVAVMLMVAPDHQDWHPDMDDYAAAKQHIFTYQQPGDRAIYNACNLSSLTAGLGAPVDQLPYNDAAGAWVDLGDDATSGVVKMGDTVICRTGDIALAGRHNWDNVCAAVAATWPIVGEAAPIAATIRAFRGLPHRLETVAEFGGVTYVNDSYSANPEPAIAAINSYAQPKLLILGGFDRGMHFERLAAQVASGNVRAVVTLGATAPRIEAALQAAGYQSVRRATDLVDAVRQAAATAKSGDVVLLSPGCPSFDMFRDFQERGERFKELVHQLEGKHE